MNTSVWTMPDRWARTNIMVFCMSISLSQPVTTATGKDHTRVVTHYIQTLKADEGEKDVNDNEGACAANSSRAVHHNWATPITAFLLCGLLQAHILCGEKERLAVKLASRQRETHTWRKPSATPGSWGTPWSGQALKWNWKTCLPSPSCRTQVAMETVAGLYK